MNALGMAHAALIPRGWASDGGRLRPAAAHRRANALFGPLLGCKSLWWLDVPAGKFGVPRDRERGNPMSDLRGAGILLPTGHPHKGRDRYAWYWCQVQGGSLAPMGRLDSPGDGPYLTCPKVGYLLPDEAAGDPAIEAAAHEAAIKKAEAMRKAFADHMAPPELREHLQSTLGLPPREFDAFFGKFA